MSLRHVSCVLAEYLAGAEKPETSPSADEVRSACMARAAEVSALLERLKAPEAQMNLTRAGELLLRCRDALLSLARPGSREPLTGAARNGLLRTAHKHLNAVRYIVAFTRRKFLPHEHRAE